MGVARLINRIKVYIRIIRGEVGGKRRRRGRRARRDIHQAWYLGERLRVETYCWRGKEREREEELYYQKPNGKGLFVVRPKYCSDTGPDPLP